MHWANISIFYDNIRCSIFISKCDQIFRHQLYQNNFYYLFIIFINLIWFQNNISTLFISILTWSNVNYLFDTISKTYPWVIRLNNWLLAHIIVRKIKWLLWKLLKLAIEFIFIRHQHLHPSYLFFNIALIV